MNTVCKYIKYEFLIMQTWKFSLLHPLLSFLYLTQHDLCPVWTVHSMMCIVYAVYTTTYTVHYLAHPVLYVLLGTVCYPRCIVHSVLYTILHTVHSILYINILYTLYHILCALYPILHSPIQYTHPVSSFQEPGSLLLPKHILARLSLLSWITVLNIDFHQHPGEMFPGELAFIKD